MLTFMDVNGIVYTATEPELKFTTNKKPVVNFSVASNRKWSDGGGAEHEDSCFINCVGFGKLAEVVDDKVRKGDPLYIEGNLKLDSWEADDGAKRSRHSVVLNRVVFLKPKE